MNASENQENNRKQDKVSQWIDRYVHDVTRHLPASQRSDIDQELHTLIDDLLLKQAAGRTAEEADVLAVLHELGAPRKLAGNYLDHPRYLIGPQYIELYWLVLRIVLVVVGLGMILALSIQLVIDPPASVWAGFGSVFADIWQALVGAFGMVTLIFALNEHINRGSAAKIPNLDANWKPSDLPQLSSASMHIPRSEPIVSIIFTLIFMVILNVNIDLIGAYFQQGDTWISIPFFSHVLRDNLLWINLVLLLGIVLESIKLIVGSWTLALAGLHFLLKIPGMLLGVWLWSNPALINPEFFPKLGEVFNTDLAVLTGNLPDNIRRVVLFLIIFGFILDSIKPFVKTFRVRPVINRQTEH